MQLEFLRRFNFTAYDISTLDFLVRHGRAAAADIAKQANVPTSKIYNCLNKLEELGMVRLENTSPKIYSIVENDQLIARLGNLGQSTAVEFARNLQQLSEDIAHLAAREEVTQRSMLMAEDLDSYLKKHLPRVGEAKQNIYTHWQDFNAQSDFIDTQYLPMFFGKSTPAQHMLLTSKNVSAHHPVSRQIEARVTHFDFGGNFHIWDGRNVLLVTGNAFTGVRGSMLIQDEGLYAKLADGFMQEWYAAEPA